MTEDHKDQVLADCLEAYHRQRARGEVPDMMALKQRLPEELHEDFVELVAAETAIDEALEPGGDAALPLAWGKYTILREIARGAAGVVYEALHRELGRKVALKVLRTGLDTDEVTRERFRREAQALAQVHHDHIVEIYEFGELEDRPFYAMSLVEGPTLADLVKRDERPDPREVCEGLADIANALHTLHEAGMIHRDVKPSNIMIDLKTGRYMLADFGLARTAMSATVTRTGDALGTPLYMSPEQMLGNRDAIEARTDVYGFGATLYQMLTGKPPFKTDNLHALMRMVLSERPESARAANPELPEGCSRIAMKCLEKEARDRYDTAGELEEDLRAFADGRRVAGKPLSRWQRNLRLVRSHPVYATAAAVILGLAVWLAVRVPPAYMSVEPKLEARVRFADSDTVLPTPVRNHKLRPGTYDVTVTPIDERFKPQEARFTAEAGVHTSVALNTFEPKDPTRTDAALPDVVGGPRPEFKEDGTRRSGGDEEVAVELWFPRGKVTASEARTWRAYAGIFLPEDGGYLVFMADETQLARLRFPEPDEIGEISDAMADPVLAALKPGARVTWHFEDKRGKRMGVPASFEIVDYDAEAAFAELDAKLNPLIEGWESDDARESARLTLHAQVLIRDEQYTAAARLLLPVIKQRGGTQLQIALYKSALQSLMSADRPTRRVYKDWQLWGDLLDYRKRFSEEEWDTFYAERASK